MKLLLEISCFAFFCVYGLYAFADYTGNPRLSDKLDALHAGVMTHVDALAQRAEVRIDMQREKLAENTRSDWPPLPVYKPEEGRYISLSLAQ